PRCVARGWDVVGRRASRGWAVFRRWRTFTLRATIAVAVVSGAACAQRRGVETDAAKLGDAGSDDGGAGGRPGSGGASASGGATAGSGTGGGPGGSPVAAGSGGVSSV